MQQEKAFFFLKRGRELLEDGNPAQAALVLEKARALEPRKGSILEVLGRAYYSCGRYLEAARSFEDAVDVDPTNDYAHYCLGLCYLKQKRQDDAAGHIKTAWFLRPCDIYREMAARFGVADNLEANDMGSHRGTADN